MYVDPVIVYFLGSASIVLLLLFLLITWLLLCWVRDLERESVKLWGDMRVLEGKVSELEAGQRWTVAEEWCEPGDEWKLGNRED